jgi:c-di-GMP-binding flagellar brake protein YcgR
VIKERNKRIPIEISCWLEGADGVSSVTTYDLSETGVSVLSSDPLPEGRVVSLRVFTPFAAEAIALKAEVVWSRTEPEGGMGLRFLNMDENIRSVLRGTVHLLRMRVKASQKMVTGRH